MLVFKRISEKRDKNGQHIFPLSSTALKKTSWDFDIHQGDMETVFRFLQYSSVESEDSP